MQEVADGIYRLQTGMNGARDSYAAYVIDADEPVLVEPGPAAVVPAILEGIRRLGVRRLSYVIPTHIHMDHGGGMGTLAEMFPEAKVVVHPRGARHAVDPSRLIAATRLAYSGDFERLYGPILPVPASQVMSPKDGEVIVAGDRRLRVIYTPGHAPHHMSILDGDTRGLFCGEALGVLVQGSDDAILPSVSAQDFDLGMYLESIDRLWRLQPTMLFYSHHGGARPPGDLMPRLVENVLTIRDMVLQGLRNGEPADAIEGRVRRALSVRLGSMAGAMNMDMTIEGYGAYLRREGLV